MPSNAVELLFLEHIMKKLKPRDGARCGMVMPEGTLFHGGAFAVVKKDLLEQRGRTPSAPTDTRQVGAHGVRPPADARADGHNAGGRHPPLRTRAR